MNLVSLFERQSAATPAATALIDRGTLVTYQALDRRANQYARALQRLGVRPGGCVVLRLRRSAETIASIIGTLKASAVFVPCEVGLPGERLQKTLVQCRPSLFVNGGDPVEADARTLTEMEWHDLAADEHDGAVPARNRETAQPCCVLFTSGSTGTPNAVLIDSEAVSSRLLPTWTRWPFQAGDLAAIHRPLGIVGSLWDVFGPLLKGIPCVVVASDASVECLPLWRVITEHGVTHLSASPSLWTAILDIAEESSATVKSLRLGMSAGEPLPADLVRRWAAVFPHGTLINIYGSTECHTPLACDTSRARPAASTVHAGHLLGDALVAILDDRLRPSASGETGELYVSGPGLALGYLGSPALTAARFVCLPQGSGQRMYRTGDLARQCNDGEIEVVGRADRILKLRGFRIDPSEVESALTALPEIRQALVKLWQRPGMSSALLVAYVAGAALPEDWRGRLRRTLPSHMVPGLAVAIGSLPLTPSGKVDVNRLPSPIQHASPSVDEACADPTLAVLQDLLKAVLSSADVNPEYSFEDLGGDSLLALRLVSRVRGAFGVEVSTGAVFDASTMRSLASQISELSQQ